VYRWWPDLLGSWVFYSILPLPHGCRPRFERIARFAPVVGLGLGGTQAVIWQLGAWAGCPPGGLGALVLALGLWLTGGLHFDGVLDSGDGLAAGRSEEVV
jgi:adenosylcobinamide-GDP ribazoletransferase